MTDPYYVITSLLFASGLVYLVWIWREVIDVVNSESDFEPEFSTHVVAAFLASIGLAIASAAWPLTLLVLGTLKVKAIVTKGARP